jgi:exopolysaccharide biosynthesis protein
MHPALAVVNGGFFSDHPEEVNSGIFKWQGSVWPFTREEPEELRFVGSSAIGLDAGGNWIFMNRMGNAWTDDWPEAVSALAGAHRLIDAGAIPEPVKSGRWRSSREIRHSGLRHPRTAVCVTDDPYIILLVADGRHREAVGFTLTELAKLMHHLGCTDAVNLDGGGSSTMYIEGSGVVNHPSDNRVFDREGERPVRTLILIEKGE